jgi:O-antigen/teichoic acid export membrane protein
VKSIQHYYYAGGYVLSVISTVLMNVIVARSLGAAAYGALSIARAIYQMLLIVAPLGTDLGLQRFVTADRHDAHQRRLVSLSRHLALAVSITAFIVLSAAAPAVGDRYGAPEMTSAIVWTLLALPFATEIVMLGAIGRIKGDLKPYIAATLVLQPLLRLALTALAVWMRPDVETVAIASTAGIVASWLVYRSAERLPPLREQGRIARFGHVRRQFLSTSLWLCSGLFFYGCLRSADLLIVGLFVPAREVGRYAAIGFVAQMVQALAFAVAQGVGPRIAAAHAASDAAGMRDITREAMRTAGPMSLFLFGGVGSFGADLHVVFGPDFTTSPLVPIALGFGYLAGGLLGMTGFSLSMTGRHKLESTLIVCGGSAMAFGSGLGASRYGIEGAAVCSCVVLTMMNAARALIARKIIGFPLPECALLLAAVPMLGIGYGTRAAAHQLFSDGLLQFATGCLLYGLVALVLLLALRNRLPRASARVQAP